MYQLNRTPLLLAFLMALSGLMFLAGCAPLTVHQGNNPAPAELVQECPAPVTDFSTQGGLVRSLLGYIKALADCNDDKAALRLWNQGK